VELIFWAKNVVDGPLLRMLCHIRVINWDQHLLFHPTLHTDATNENLNDLVE